MRLFLPVSLLLWAIRTGASHAAEPTGAVMVEAKNTHAATKWTQHKTTLLTHLPGFTPAPLPLGKFGGRTDRKEKATGFFHTLKSGDDWVLVDPEGCHFLSVGMCSTSPATDRTEHQEQFSRRKERGRSDNSIIRLTVWAWPGFIATCHVSFALNTPVRFTM